MQCAYTHIQYLLNFFEPHLLICEVKVNVKPKVLDQ